MKGYTHNTINVNNREVTLTELVSDKIASSTDFESETFSFIRSWLQGVDSFNLHTSGSTGAPKEITLTRKQLQQSAQRTIQALDLSQNDAALICLDTKYIAGKMMLVRALEANMKIIAVEPTSNPLLKLPLETSISFAAFVPLQLQEMLKHSEFVKKLNQLKNIIVGGGSVNASLQADTQILTCTVYSTYGMTETVSHIALQRLNGTEVSDHFTVLPGIHIEVDDRGCLVIQLPEFSEKIITNDLVDLLSPTSFRWLGRFDNVINSGGFKVSPEKIEKVVEHIFQERKINRSFIVCGIPDDRLGQKLILVIEGFPISGQKKILSALQQHLHPYEIPKQIFNIREFIRTETGKINRIKTAGLIG
jgi:O-succinylbenzoic acid--CoA ligase